MTNDRNKLEGEMPYFHEIADSEWESMKADGVTWGEVSAKYDAPPWCGIAAEAVDPMGCWSLVSTRTVRREDDCKGCPEYQKQNPGNLDGNRGSE